MENYFFELKFKYNWATAFYLATLQYEVFRKSVGVLLVVSMTEW